MNMAKNLALLIATVFVARVLVTAFGLLLSIPPILFELSASEAELKVTYEILISYFLVILVVLLVVSISLFNQATNRKSFQLNFVLTAIALSVCVAHLALAIVGDPESLLVQFARSFIWVPALVGFSTLTSFLIARVGRISAA